MVEAFKDISARVIASKHKEYIALAPEDKEDEVYFYGYKENGEEFELVEIESDDEFQEVVKVFNQLMGE